MLPILKLKCFYKNCENTKIVINGISDDLPNKSLSGLNSSKKLLKHLKEISVIDFDHHDVVRHPLVSKIVKAYSDKSENDKSWGLS